MIDKLGEKNRRILIVDDNPRIHEDYRRVLGAVCEDYSEIDSMAAEYFDDAADENDLGVHFHLDSAKQGMEAIQMLWQAHDESRPHAVAFVDMRMPPGWDGLETIERIWQVDPRIQCVICTAFSDYSLKDIIGRLGHSDKLLFIRKPFDQTEVAQIAISLSEKWNMAQLLEYNMRGLDEMMNERTRQLLDMEEEALLERARKEETREIIESHTSPASRLAIEKLGTLWSESHKRLDPQGQSKAQEMLDTVQADFSGLAEFCKYFEDISDRRG